MVEIIRRAFRGSKNKCFLVSIATLNGISQLKDALFEENIETIEISSRCDVDMAVIARK